MKQLIVIALVLVTGLALASDKDVDHEDYTMESASRLQVVGELTAGSSTWDRARALSSELPNLDCMYPLTFASQSGQYYAYYCVTSTDDQPIEVVVDNDATEINDTTLHLYCGDFDPEAPLDSCIHFDDDGGEGLSSAFTLEDNIVLTPGTTYFLVFSTYGSGYTGGFELNISDNVAICSVVATEDMSWDRVKGLYR